MKRKLSALCSILLTLSFGITSAATDSFETYTQPSDRYSYEIAVSNEVWEEMTYPEKVEAYSISQDLLESMTTPQVVQAVMDYPFLVDLTLFNTTEEGYAHVLSCSDALQELVKREDGFMALVYYYKHMPVPLRDEPGDTSIIELTFAEILISNMAREVVISEQQFYDLTDTINTKAAEKAKATELYGTEPNLKITGTQPYRAEFTSHTVKSLKGVNVSVIHYLSDLSTSQKKQENTEYSSAYPQATILGSATNQYNCASYAMINRSTSNIYWLNNLSPSAAGYTRLGSSLTNATPGGIIYYSRTDSLGSHVGVVHSTSGGTIIVRSKMGMGPLAQHQIQMCPYYLDNTGLIFYN